ncbi:hypothetical protein ACSSV1_001723 [Labrenzia sp. MBR-25]
MKVSTMNLKTSRTLQHDPKTHSVSARPGSKQIGSFQEAASARHAKATKAWARKIEDNPKLRALQKDAKRLVDA